MAGLTAAGAALSAAPAQAATCSVAADLPARVSIAAEHLEVPVRLVDTCGARYASFEVWGPDGRDQFLVWGEDGEGAPGSFHGTRSDWWAFSDWQRPGTYRTAWGKAFGPGDEHYPVAYDSMDVRFGTKAGLSARRSGGTVTLTVDLVQYHPFQYRFVPYGGAKATVQVNQGGTWTYVKSVTVGKDGKAVVAHAAPRSAQYRVVSWDTAPRWGATSKPVTA
ncbi:hypothetical protein D5H78_14080 [Vallicoccus soli]|uniref:Uncharacterized protein n=1 Tax=Vallicoccus soli TaxID=2339232 RepID=A0A3A3YY59_9ACTN|nr:hypothetical protein D5H78_14080 [Vallicoccus soli]